MSYTGSIKNELGAVMPESRCCRLSEISGLINTSAYVSEQSLVFRTENWVVAGKYFTLLKKTFNIVVENKLVKKAKHDKNSAFELVLSDIRQLERVFSSTGTSKNGSFLRHISGIVIKKDCCKRSYLRGAFLAGGSIASPDKGYHLEISLKSRQNAEELINLLSYFEIVAKPKKRTRGVSVYIKDSEKIADFLNAAGAKNALFSYQNTKVVKEVRNDVNRLVNCDTANINKTVQAAAKQILAIELIDKTIGIDSLGATLKKAAITRLENPDLKLEELGALLGIGKSGINHRLRKIEEIAKELESNF